MSDPLAEYGPRLTHDCAAFGHKWKHMGGANCGCPDGGCSVPVHECTECHDCDYGDNEWATKTRQECAQEREDNP